MDLNGYLRVSNMAKRVEDFLFGLCFGLGFICAEGLKNLILALLNSHTHV